MLFIELIRILIWPLVVVIAILMFRKTIQGLIPGANINLKLYGVEINTTAPELTRVLTENVRNRSLSDSQWDYMTSLLTVDNKTFEYDRDYKLLQPLRNAGLIRENPEGYLTNCATVEITTLGRFLCEARLHI